MVALMARPAGAAQWSFEPSIDGRLSYDDNITLTPNTRDSVWGVQAAPRAVFAWREALTELAGEARLGVNRYPNKSNLDTTDLLSELRFSTASERNSYGLNARFDRDSTLASEARQTGVVQTRRQRTKKSIAPSYRRSLSDRTSASLRYEYYDVAYESGSGLRPYRNHQLGAGYTWLVSERLRADSALSWDDLRTDDRGVLTSTRSLSQGLSYGLTERITLDANAGWRRSKTTVNSLLCPLGAQLLCDVFRVAPVAVSRSSVERGLLLGVDARFALERGNYLLSVSRGTSPTGNGLTVRTDRLGVRWTGEWSERVTLGASASRLWSVYDGDLAAGSRYLNFDASIALRLDERWTLGAQYAYVRSRTDNAPDGARANSLFLTLSYQWPPVSLK